MVPSKWRKVKEFKLTPNGKTNRKDIDYVMEYGSLTTDINPDDDVHKIIFSCLELPYGINVSHNLFDTILTQSFLVLQFYQSLKKHYSYITLEALYTYPTIKLLHNYITKEYEQNPLNLYYKRTSNIPEIECNDLIGSYIGNNGVNATIWKEEDIMYFEFNKSKKTRSILRKSSSRFKYECYVLAEDVSLDYDLTRTKNGLFLDTKTGVSLFLVIIRNLKLTKI
jgi:hypothetical protein